MSPSCRLVAPPPQGQAPGPARDRLVCPVFFWFFLRPGRRAVQNSRRFLQLCYGQGLHAAERFFFFLVSDGQAFFFLDACSFRRRQQDRQAAYVRSRRPFDVSRRLSQGLYKGALRRMQEATLVGSPMHRRVVRQNAGDGFGI